MPLHSSNAPKTDAEATLDGVQKALDVLKLVQDLLANPSKLNTLASQVAQSYQMSDAAKASFDNLQKQALAAQQTINQVAAAQSKLAEDTVDFAEAKATAKRVADDADAQKQSGYRQREAELQAAEDKLAADQKQ